MITITQYYFQNHEYNRIYSQAYTKPVHVAKAMIAINHVVRNETSNFGQPSQSRLLITDKTTVTYIFVVEFLVVRVPTSSPTATDTHYSSKHIGED